ncbi:fructose repressor FruR LacI family [Vibrio maritimus]|uniref:Fructose repressor FruR LacI family n=1 Tax=Vibrio maritimus TaxID=990268 RepID=A0A090RRE4_9VIBR|nr:fructose repressor FruR LacI family [Vibrio maritimus]
MTLDEIAKLAGVSKTTASYVINGKAQKYRISEKTQRKVMVVVEEHNYRPDHAASSLRAGQSRSFGLIILTLRTPVMHASQNCLSRTLVKRVFRY